MGMHIRVRKAEERDLEWISGQLRIFSAYLGSKKPLYPGDAQVKDALAGLINSHVLLVSETDEGVLTGMIGGAVGPHPWSGVSTLSEIFWWVADEFRGTRSGLMLINEFIAWGKQNAEWVVCSLEAESPINDRTLLRRGFRLMERTFFMEVA